MMATTTTVIVPIPPATTLTYDQSASLMTDMNFRGRVKVACLKFAESVLDGPNTQPAYNTLLKWSAQCLQNPDQMATQVQPPTVMDTAVQSAGSGIDDDALQGSVEVTIKKML
jgi:hypothetical protein